VSPGRLLVDDDPHDHRGEPARASGDLERVLGRKPLSFGPVVAVFAGVFR
jgi:hypothetical protein